METSPGRLIIINVEEKWVGKKCTEETTHVNEQKNLYPNGWKPISRRGGRVTGVRRGGLATI